MKFSVATIIPVNNRQEVIKRAIDSVLNQTLKPQEIIVVDDGSADDTPEILKTYGSQIKIIRQKNRGVSAARNRGVRESKSDWLAFLDSDDEWHKDKLAKQINYVQQNPQAEIVQADEVWVRKGKKVNPMKKHLKKSGNIFKECLPLCIVTAGSVLMKRELFERVGGFDENIRVCEDYDLWLRIARDTSIYLMPEKLLTRYGGHEDQLSGKHWGMDRFRVYALKKLLKGMLTDEQRQLVIKELKYKCNILANGAKKRRKYLRWLYYLYLGKKDS